MTTPSEVRQSELLNQLVLDRDTMEELGRVELLWMYPQAHRVLGFICKSGLLGGKKSAFKLAQVVALGANGVLTHSQPEATDADRVNRLESLLQHEVWSDQGNRVGKITDCLFDLQTGNITHYLFVSSGWTGILGEVYQLAPEQIVSVGKTRVLVAEAASSHFALYRPGLRQKLTEVGEYLKTEASQEWRSLNQRAEALTEETKERLQDLTAQTRERASRLSQETREQVKGLNDQLQEGGQSWIDRLKDKSQTVAKRLKQQTHHLSRQVEEGIETIVVQAEEIFDAGPSPAQAPARSEQPAAGESAAPQKNEPQKNEPQKNESQKNELDDDEPWI